MLFLILSTKVTINGESAFRTYQNKEAGRFVWSYLKRSYILTFLRSYTPHYKQESAENFLAMVTLTNFIYKLSRLSHLVRHSKYYPEVFKFERGPDEDFNHRFKSYKRLIQHNKQNDRKVQLRGFY